MFYLRTFYQSVWDLKFRGISFIMMTLGILVFAGHENTVRNLVSVNQKVQVPYFNALIDQKIDTTGIVRKMKNLPGVLNVSVKSSRDLEQDVKKMVRDIDEAVVDNLLQVQYQGIRVELERSLETRGQKLIQEYLNRLVGRDSVTMTDVNVPKITIAKEDSYKSIFIQWVDQLVLFCVSIVWIFASWTCSKSLLTRSYLIEKFQRKKSVALKSYLLGMSTIYLIALSVSIALNLNIYYVTMIYIASLLIGTIFNSQKLKLISIR